MHFKKICKIRVKTVVRLVIFFLVCLFVLAGF